MGPLVDPPEQSSIVHDVPDPVCNLLEPDVLVTEGIAEKGLRGVQAESAAVADTTDLHMVGILRRNDPLGIGVRRRLPERCRHLIADAFVGSLLIVAPAEGVELPLLAAQGVRRWTRRLGLHRRQAAAHEERPAEVIGDRERVAVLPVSGLELPLEVRRPHLVRSLRLERSGTRVRPLLATPVLAEPAVPLKDVVDRTARRPGDRGRSRPEHLQELLRSPSVLDAGGEDQRLDLRRRPMRARMRRPASLGHPRAARLPKAAHPLVTGRPRHTVPLAELRHRPLAAFEVLREPQPLFRRTRLHPGHPLGVNDVPGLLLTMCPGRTAVYNNTAMEPIGFTWLPVASGDGPAAHRQD